MRVLVIGGLGSIGSRYVAILKYLGHEPIIQDIKIHHSVQDITKREFDRAIIATPTDTHYDNCKVLIATGKPFLCEKPLSKNLKECEELTELDRNKFGRVVINYAYITSKPIGYDYYKTGNDGLYWDCCQLIYLNPEIDLQNSSPTWTLLNEHKEVVPYYELERSYITMVKDWMADNCDFDLECGAEMTNAVLDRMERDKCAC